MSEAADKKMSEMAWGWSQKLALAAGFLLLCGAMGESMRFLPPPDTAAYRAHVREETLAVPSAFGDWIGNPIAVEPSAVRLLRPNVMLSRQYHNVKTGDKVGFLFVDCQDARDTIGHYPPICYQAEGWSQQMVQPKDWKLPHMTIHGTEYTYARGIFDANGLLVVDDFFVLPALGTAPNRDGVIAAARDLQRRFYGVAQIQLVFEAHCTAEEREQAFMDLIGPIEGLITTVEDVGVKPAPATPKSVNGAVN